MNCVAMLIVALAQHDVDIWDFSNNQEKASPSKEPEMYV
jgi:hypothetical protein